MEGEEGEGREGREEGEGGEEGEGQEEGKGIQGGEGRHQSHTGGQGCGFHRFSATISTA